MISDVFNDLMKQSFVIDGIARHITKKGANNLLNIEVKNFIRSNPEAKLESASVRFDKSANQYLFTYNIANKKGSKTYYKTMVYITRYQMMDCFKEVEDK